MLLIQDAGSEPRGIRTMRVAMIAGAVGSLIGGAVVIASVATVFSVLGPEPANKYAAVAPKSPPSRAQPTRVASPVGRNDCADQTWPNIEGRCLTRVDDVHDQVTPRAASPSVTKVAMPAPAKMQPGSPALPAPPTFLESNPMAAVPVSQVQAIVHPQPVAEPQPAQPPGDVAAPVVTAPPQKAVTSKPTRKAERVRQAARALARRSDDDADDTGRPSTAIRPPTVMSYHRAEPTDVVIERPRRLPAPFGFFGALLGPNDD